MKPSCNQVEVGKVQIRGSAATAQLSGEGQVARLVRVGDDWLITDLDFGGPREAR